jgi:pimeloyl-ACP methyl ester carboxylesterase
MESWAKVVPEVGTFATAFAYNRAGYPGSGIRVSPHAGAEVIEELRALLLAQGLPPPYVLVGHSLGGLYFQLYVRTYPSEVAGLVLVDPTHQDQLRHLRQKMPAQYALISTNLNLGVGATSAEWRGMAETERQTRAAGAPPAVPVILLSGRKTLPLVEGPDFAELKLKLHGEIVAQFVGAQHRILDDSGHYVQRDRPDAVVQAIRDVIARPVVRQ